MIVTCEDMLIDCTFKGKVENCSQVFTARPTDEGICCSFNSDETGWNIRSTSSNKSVSFIIFLLLTLIYFLHSILIWTHITYYKAHTSQDRYARAPRPFDRSFCSTRRQCRRLCHSYRKGQRFQSVLIIFLFRTAAL